MSQVQSVMLHVSGAPGSVESPGEAAQAGGGFQDLLSGMLAADAGQAVAEAGVGPSQTAGQGPASSGQEQESGVAGDIVGELAVAEDAGHVSDEQVQEAIAVLIAMLADTIQTEPAVNIAVSGENSAGVEALIPAQLEGGTADVEGLLQTATNGLTEQAAETGPIGVAGSAVVPAASQGVEGQEGVSAPSGTGEPLSVEEVLPVQDTDDQVRTTRTSIPAQKVTGDQLVSAADSSVTASAQESEDGGMPPVANPEVDILDGQTAAQDEDVTGSEAKRAVGFETLDSVPTETAVEESTVQVLASETGMPAGDAEPDVESPMPVQRAEDVRKPQRTGKNVHPAAVRTPTSDEPTGAESDPSPEALDRGAEEPVAAMPAASAKEETGRPVGHRQVPVAGTSEKVASGPRIAKGQPENAPADAPKAVSAKAGEDVSQSAAPAGAFRQMEEVPAAATRGAAMDRGTTAGGDEAVRGSQGVPAAADRPGYLPESARSGAAEAAGSAQERLDREAVLDQVVRSARMHVERGSTRFEMRLEPPRLGRVGVVMELHDGALSISFRADNEAVRELLQNSMPQLRAALGAQGVSIEGLDVSSSGNGGGQQADAGERTWQGGGSGRPGDGYGRRQPADEQPAAAFDSRSRRASYVEFWA